MTDQVLLRTLLQLFTSIESCIERKVQLPTLMLIYSGIDGLAWLSVENNTAVRPRFEQWVEKYLFAAKSFTCSATDLYAARCGVLHTFTGDSGLLSQKKAKSIAYAWGNADATALQRALDLACPGECFALHISDLAEAMRVGTARMFDDAKTDHSLQRRLEKRGRRYFQPLTTDFKRGSVYSEIKPSVT